MDDQSISPEILKSMTDQLVHRGPDDEGYYFDQNIGLGQRRLSIIDLKTGQQPIHNELKSIWVIFNGEIFNYIELRDQLVQKGHKFYTHSDTEVIVHMYEEYGQEFLQKLNGQFAIALFDKEKKQLTLARDRVGIRPLFYSMINNKTLLFGSEIKAILRYPEMPREIDPEGIHQIFTYWVNIPPRTVFKSVYELPPGSYLVCSSEGWKIKPYWNLNFPNMGEYEEKSFKYYQDNLAQILYDATTIRLRADVPVASYLSGGIDSSIISSLVKKNHNNDLITFSVSFKDPSYDERQYQEQMVRYLKTNHFSVDVDEETIGNNFSNVVWFSEKPMIRTAPAPLYLLSRLVNQNKIKVVLTGEGADEVFGGYNIFKEDKIRRYWAREPSSKIRPMLLAKLYPYIQKNGRSTDAFWQQFFKKNLTDTENPYYSHIIRWSNTSAIKLLFSKDFSNGNHQKEIADDLVGYLDVDLNRWHPLSRSQYIEMKLFMSGYLLSSQGDRMMMGNSVEGRFPYLDHRVIEFASNIPPRFKINGLDEKYILKKTYKNIIPGNICTRPKQPYRAPISRCFVGENTNPLLKDLLDLEKIKKYGFFDPIKVEKLYQKINRIKNLNISARDDMAIVAIASLQLLNYHFIDNFNH